MSRDANDAPIPPSAAATAAAAAAARARGAAPAPSDSDDDVRAVPNGPFEWLTNFDSLRHLLDPAFLFPDGDDDDGGDDEENAAASSAIASPTPVGGRRRGGRGRRRRRVLNVGCGSSTIGESLVERSGYAEAVNADVDGEALRTMEARWRERISGRRERGGADGGEVEVAEGAMRFVRLDFAAADGDEAEAATDGRLGGPFDVVLDKSTLDCALCSDDAASGLLCRAYRSLRVPAGSGDAGGVLLVVSFHPKEFILPLLRDCPGASWDIEHHVVERAVDVPEHMAGRRGAGFRDEKKEEDAADVGNFGAAKTSAAGAKGAGPASAWRDGTFAPDDEYCRTANVFLCRRRGSGGPGAAEGPTGLDRDAVRDHVHVTNDDWFRVHNPMVTHAREEDLRRAFGERLGGEGGGRNRLLPLRECYGVLFTDAEREHLEYDHFLEDWEAFVSSSSPSAGDGNGNGDGRVGASCREEGMSVETALRFLEVMQ